MTNKHLDVERILNDQLQLLKDRKIKGGYGVDLRPQITVIESSGRSHTFEFGWRNNDEKYILFDNVRQFAKLTRAIMVLSSIDARTVRIAKFTEHFGIHEGDDFDEVHSRIIDEHGGTVAGLPRDLWGEGLMVGVQGPAVGSRSITLPYEEGPNKTVHFLDSEQWGEEPGQRFVNNLLKPWWGEAEGKVQ